MQSETVRQSPFVFLKNFIIIEVVFAVIPVILLLSVDIERFYDAMGLARGLPFVLVWTLFVTLLQIVAVTIAFLAWYLPRYTLAHDAIYWQRGAQGATLPLFSFEDDFDIKVEQGALGRRLGYGSLVLTPVHQGRPLKIKNITNPVILKTRIESLRQQTLLQKSEAVPPRSIDELLQEGESQYVEYKSSLMWDYRQQRINKQLYKPVMKSLAAFMNARGGHLLIGVDDAGNVLGIEADLQGMKKPNLDGWENTFNLAFNKMIGVEYHHWIELAFEPREGKTICHVYVRPADRPVFLKENNKESFYVRAGNASQPLSFSQAARYIQTRFAI